MKTEDFDYPLPPDLIAQYPLENRDECRLLCLDRKTSAVTDLFFKDLTTIVKPGDLLVFNDTKVLPSRLFCHKKTGGAVELLLTAPYENDNQRWNALVRPGRGLNPGTRVTLDRDHSVAFEIVEVREDGSRIISLVNESGQTIETVFRKYGVMALPHYIKRPAESKDNETYQTVYAKHEGAVASPTAGLHFTGEFMDALKTKGINAAFVTLHVGIGTFRPVKVDDPEKHRMHSERYDLSRETVEKIEIAKKNGGRVIAVGTTVVRVLEHCTEPGGVIRASAGETDIFILPGYEFKVVDGMVTNFHVPQSTLLMLVSAFAGREAILSAYVHAVEMRYRFFSYGDAMLIL
jgi:S-adenosylmethionine:tRNA ribosyltransferase-isomerase